MYTVYVLKDKDGKVYKGVTSNIDRRLKEHARGETRTTSMMTNMKLVYKEVYETFEEARRREVYLKTAAGRRFLKTKIMPE